MKHLNLILVLLFLGTIFNTASAIEENTVVTSGVLCVVVGPKGTEYRSPVYFQSYTSGRWVTRLTRMLPLGRIRKIEGRTVAGGNSTTAAILLQRAVGQGRHGIDYVEVYATVDAGVSMLSSDVLHTKPEFDLNSVRVFQQASNLYVSASKSNYSCSTQQSPMCQYSAPPKAAVQADIKKLDKSYTQAELNERLLNGWDSLKEPATIVSFPHLKVTSVSNSSIGNKLIGTYCSYQTESSISCSGSTSFYVELP